jgi:head-tail joining protein
MTAGDLRYRVGFYKRPVAADDSPASPDYGNPEGDFSSTAEFITYANIRPRLGGEQILAARLTGENLVNITVRQSTQTALVQTSWRAKNETTGEVYQIKSIIDPFSDGVKHAMYFEMLCEKGVAA